MVKEARRELLLGIAPALSPMLHGALNDFPPETDSGGKKKKALLSS